VTTFGAPLARQVEAPLTQTAEDAQVKAQGASIEIAECPESDGFC